MRSLTATPLPSMASLLRQSKFARFDTTLNQVYEANSKGQWGTKALIPSRFPSKFITLTHLDSMYQVPNFKLADTKMKIMERFKELLPYKIPGFITSLSSNQINVATLAPKEFIQFCKEKQTQCQLQQQQQKPSQPQRLSQTQQQHPQQPPHVQEAYISHEPWDQWREGIRNEWKPKLVKGPIYQPIQQDELHQWYVYGRPIASYDRKTLVNVAGFLGVCTDYHHFVKPELTLFRINKLFWTKQGLPYIDLTYSSIYHDLTKKNKSKYTSEQSFTLLKVLDSNIKEKMGESNPSSNKFNSSSFPILDPTSASFSSSSESS